MPKANSTSWELLITDQELNKEAKRRSKETIEESVLSKEIDNYTVKGWVVKKEGKIKSTIEKAKPTGDAFEDKVWSIFYKMGFTTMNATNNFHLSYSEEHPDLTKQLDVVAIDDETCVFVECKSASKPGSKQSWQKDLNEIIALFPKLCSAIKKKYPNRKCKYIFATHNYVVGDQDRKRMADDNICYFDDNTVLYYEKLVSYLGSAAKYQLLGSLFSGQRIANMETKVPAIRGFMGGITYYSFLIKPSDLLKIGYVLHRTNANNDYEELLPSYQRLIKKDRLKKVREFVDAGGYFPNSLIISIDSKKGKKMQFDILGKDAGGDSLSQMGILHLPQTYQSAYIIDGQHRLYGYSDSKYSDKNNIPVVAFDNLDKDTQLKLFMEINENQKAVSKALRNILEIDIYYDSPNANLRKKALLGTIAKRLGEDPKSPLNGRVIIGEDAQTDKCCITIDYIKAAIDKTSFLNKYRKNGSIITTGIFDKNDNDETMKKFYPFLSRYLWKIQEYCPEEWESYITKNNAIVAVIRILEDIVDIVMKEDPNVINDLGILENKCEDFVLALASTLIELPADKRESIRTLRGEQAKEDAYRTVQMAMHEIYPDFTNDNIEKYYIEKYTNYAEKAKKEATEIKNFLKEITKVAFDEPDWQANHMKMEHHIDFASRIQKKAISNKHQGINEEIDIWSELTFNDYAKIIEYSTHWTDVYKEKLFEIGIAKTKLDFISLIKSIDSIYEKAKSGKSINLTDYTQVHSVYATISKGE